MKINKKLSFLIFMFLCFLPLSVDAASYYGVVTGAGVRVRKDPNSTNYYKMASSGEIFDMPDNVVVSPNGDCPNGYYRVKYKENVGYLCSNYLKVYEKATDVDDNKTPANDCEVAMQQAGFPASYWTGLCSLKAAHNNWNFVAVKNADGSAIDWNMSVNAESSCGKNYISSSSDAKHIDNGCTKKGDSGYSPVSQEAVRYYMDPRNFLNDVNIFMFEGQTINTSISQDTYKTASTKIFGNNFLVQNIPELPDYIRSASDSTGVSQTALATRIKQELGNAKLTSGEYNGQLYSVVSGDYTTRYGWTYNGASVDNYYNFFNVAAYDGSNVTQNAIIYAYNHKWGGTGDKNADRQLAVTGGATFLKNKYIGAGQHTIYFQKFNVYPNTTTSRYLNQYMTNIKAPVSESKITYNAYKDAGVLDSPFTFYIPVFSGMNNPVDTPNSDSTPTDTSKPTVDTIVNNAGFRYSNGYISNIKPGTSVEDVKNALEGIGGQGTVTITNANGEGTSGTIGTGYRISINGSNSETLIVVIYGDASGDGNINALDLLKVQKQILGSAQLNGSYKVAADPSKDGNVNALDLLKIQKNILGSGTIEQ